MLLRVSRLHHNLSEHNSPPGDGGSVCSEGREEDKRLQGVSLLLKALKFAADNITSTSKKQSGFSIY
jgi:hypothetical protein